MARFCKIVYFNKNVDETVFKGHRSIQSLLEDAFGTLSERVEIMLTDLSNNQETWMEEQDS